MKAVSSSSEQAFRDKAEADLVSAVVGWAKEQIGWALDTKDDAELEKRVKATLAFGRKRGMKTQRELALLFGVFCALGPGLAADARFRSSLEALVEPQRLSLLYDLLTGALHPRMESADGAAKRDWITSLT